MMTCLFGINARNAPPPCSILNEVPALASSAVPRER